MRQLIVIGFPLMTPCFVAADAAPLPLFETIKVFAPATNTDPGLPQQIFHRDGANNLYGISSEGGTSNSGTVFKLDPQGVVMALGSFSERGISISEAKRGGDGNFYTVSSGAFGTGVSGSEKVWKITPTGTLQEIAGFPGNANGASIYPAGLVRSGNGNLYGARSYGGDSGKGSIVKITPTGTATTLHTFSGPDGVSPSDNLILGADGNIYGTTRKQDGDLVGGVTLSGGVTKKIFKIDTNDQVSTVFSFPPGSASSSLAAESGGTLYGETSTVDAQFLIVTSSKFFKVAAGGSYSVVATLPPATYGPFSQASDGCFYGIGEKVLRVDPVSGVVDALPDEISYQYPGARFYEAEDGDLYGANGNEVFRLHFESPDYSYATWSSQAGLTGTHEGDDDKDGLKNLLEYAFGTNPKSVRMNGAEESGGAFIRTGMPVIRAAGGASVTGHQGVFVRRKSAASQSLSYQTQFSSDLSSWQTIAQVQTVLAASGDFEIVSVPLPAVLTDGKAAKFFRVRVSLP